MKPTFNSKILLLLATGIMLTTGCTPTYTNQDNNTSQDLNFNNDRAMDNSAKADSYLEAPPELSQQELAGKTAVIKTRLGDIKIEFFADAAPKTVSNFIFLANEGFYNDLTFHRRVEGFVLQGGDPLGNGTGGPGYQVDAEINSNKHVRGAVATARQGDAINPEKKSSGSQFYIVLEAAPHLDGDYTVFGRVVEGMDIVDQLRVGDVMEQVIINN